MEEESQEIRIPIPNTKFLLTGIKQTDNSWNIGVFDPNTGARRKVSNNVSKTVLSLYSSLVLKTPLSLNKKKQDSLKETTKQINKMT